MDAGDLRDEAMNCTKAIWDSIREGEEPLPAMDEHLSRIDRDVHEFIPKHASDIKSSFLASRPDKVERTFQELAVVHGYLAISRDLLGCAQQGESALSVYMAARDVVRSSPLTQELPGRVPEKEFESWTLKS